MLNQRGMRRTSSDADRESSARTEIVEPVMSTFRPAVDSRGYITVNASQILGHLDLSFGLVTNWGHRVLEFKGQPFNQAMYKEGDATYTVLTSRYAGTADGRVLELGTDRVWTVAGPVQRIDEDLRGVWVATEDGAFLIDSEARRASR